MGVIYLPICDCVSMKHRDVNFVTKLMDWLVTFISFNNTWEIFQVSSLPNVLPIWGSWRRLFLAVKHGSNETPMYNAWLILQLDQGSTKIGNSILQARLEVWSKRVKKKIHWKLFAELKNLFNHLWN